MKTDVLYWLQLITIPERLNIMKSYQRTFLSTFSTGKYLFLAGEIVANAEWEEPTQEEESHSLPNEFPHRKILIENGVTSIEELPEDLTSINGIGASKAEDITEFLLTLNNED